MKFKQQINAKFECKDLGELDRILNMKVTRTVEGRSIFITVTVCQGCAQEVPRVSAGEGVQI